MAFDINEIHYQSICGYYPVAQPPLPSRQAGGIVVDGWASE